MLVAIDVGNTQTVIGLFAPRDGAPADESTVGGSEHDPTRRLALHHWRIATVPEPHRRRAGPAADQLFQLRGLDRHDGHGHRRRFGVPRHGRLREMTDGWFVDVPCVIVEPGCARGMPILYDNPKEVGADRIADAVGAFDRYGGPTIVVDFGTATTFEVVSAKGEYLGGPSCPASRSPSKRSSARPPPCAAWSWSSPAASSAKNTVESVQSGVIYGFAAQVDGLCRRSGRARALPPWSPPAVWPADRAVLGGHPAPSPG